MSNTSPIQVGAVLFEGFELLDFFGPLEMFSLMKDEARITVLAEQTGSERTDVRCYANHTKCRA